jgi:hypothetical protein
MTTNEKIARWLGLETFNAPLEDNILVVYKDNKRITLDFAGDRNQQGWIEDKLIEEKFRILYQYLLSEKKWIVVIDYENGKLGADKTNQSKDVAFIQAVEQIIDKENEEI